MTTRMEQVAHVKTALGEDAAAHDIDGLVDALADVSEDFDGIDADLFWETVARFERGARLVERVRAGEILCKPLSVIDGRETVDAMPWIAWDAVPVERYTYRGGLFVLFDTADELGFIAGSILNPDGTLADGFNVELWDEIAKDFAGELDWCAWSLADGPGRSIAYDSADGSGLVVGYGNSGDDLADAVGIPVEIDPNVELDWSDVTEIVRGGLGSRVVLTRGLYVAVDWTVGRWEMIACDFGVERVLRFGAVEDDEDRGEDVIADAVNPFMAGHYRYLENVGDDARGRAVYIFPDGP